MKLSDIYDCSDDLKEYSWTYSPRRKIWQALPRPNFSYLSGNFSSYATCNLMLYIVNNIRKNTLGNRNFQERQKMLKSFYHGCLEFPEQLDFVHYIGKYFFMKKMAFCRCVTCAFMMDKSPVFYVSSQGIPLTIITFYTAQKMKFSIKDSFSKCDQNNSQFRHIYWRNP